MKAPGTNSAEPRPLLAPPALREDTEPPTPRAPATSLGFLRGAVTHLVRASGAVDTLGGGPGVRVSGSEAGARPRAPQTAVPGAPPRAPAGARPAASPAPTDDFSQLSVFSLVSRAAAGK